MDLFVTYLIWEKMVRYFRVWLCCFITLVVASTLPNSQGLVKNENGMKSTVFLSPKIELKPGSVSNKFYYNIDFPKGHIAVKSFNAELVDEAGNPIPLHETYVHHWTVFRSYQRKDVEFPEYHGSMGFFNQSYMILLKNSGLCGHTFEQFFGLGSETRKTNTHVPDPYGIEMGNPSEVPERYEERWVMNLHAIDTREVEDKLGCTECRCDLYNVTKDEYGNPLKPGYVGGLECCYDGTQCRLRADSSGSAKRGIYMRYEVKWLDWDTSIVPVRVYIFDVTDLWKKQDGLTGSTSKHHCLIEYQVESCSATGLMNDGCIDTKRVSLTMPTGGTVVYGVAHQHAGGIGSTLYGEGGRIICTSMPTYGDGKEVGNEAGYIVGMSTCYPNAGSVTISDGETLVLESNYSRSARHIGVMAIFYLLVADSSPKPNSLHHAEKPGMMAPPSIALCGVGLLGVAIAIAIVVVHYKRKKEREEVYQPIVNVNSCHS